MRGAAAALISCLPLLLAGVAAAGGPTARRSVAPDRCAAAGGTLVAVDFAHWGGPVIRGCATHQAAGYALLHAAGFTTAGDDHDGPAFICRLGDAAFARGTQYPTARQQSCAVTPPASAYWSSWVAVAGQRRWAYAQLGATGEATRPGEVELWTFGGTNITGSRGSGVPSFSPAEVRSSAAGPSVGRAGLRLVDALPTRETGSAGSARGLVLGGCAALLLGAAAGGAVWRRRRFE